MAQTRQRKGKWLFAMALAAAGIVVVVLLMPRERLLLARSTRIASASDWQEIQWVSSQQVRFTRYFSKSNADDGEHRYFTYDLVRKAEQPEPLWTKRLAQMPRKNGRGLSPDGSMGYSLSRDGTATFVDFATGRETRVAADEKNWHSILWFTGSTSWLNIVEEARKNGNASSYSHLFAHDLDAPDRVRPIENTPSHPFYERMADDKLVCAGHSIYALHYATDILKTSAPVVELRTHDLRAPANAHTRTPIRLPGRALILGAVFSPQADRIAWILESKQPSLLTWLLCRIPMCPDGTETRHALWISKLDGTQMQEIGHLSFVNIDEAPPPAIECLNWLPDGKRVSFVYEGALYTTSADQ